MHIRVTQLSQVVYGSWGEDTGSILVRFDVATSLDRYKENSRAVAYDDACEDHVDSNSVFQGLEPVEKIRRGNVCWDSFSRQGVVPEGYLGPGMDCNLEDGSRLAHIENLCHPLPAAIDNSHEAVGWPGGHPQPSRRDSPHFLKVVGEGGDAVLAVIDVHGRVRRPDEKSGDELSEDEELQVVDRVDGSKLGP